ncbi:RNA polymerase sigma factor [Paludisphaera mucosa]|uniref:Sigma-70 family RNA polymerase sigma factor n=1 Tax=Paludisphaera mucosa TaxID=3030827 RepID=A0ABT6FB37_9BACT|nr:sigma-70 family RNA polymerase sigma factor [Paludisphaera mucosa]MDG3004654.1 sigma-70 family RNA polymerase sigma factor [Paludisphaera mucosa]
MTRSTSSPAGLRALFHGGTATGMTDGQLLERFRSRDGSSDPAAAEAAFGALVDRHAALVWGVCRRGLRDRADAEDAFQATFLVLVRKAGSVRVDERGSLGRWLYGVARRVSGRLRQEAARRPAATVDPTSGDDPAVAAERREACDAVAAELDQLPAKYRRPIELCHFEGLTYEQAGRSLGWPTATLKSRLARGRLRLRGRLARRGLAPLSAIAAAHLARECRAGVPRVFIPPTIRAGAIASGVVPAAVARLAEGAIRTMMWDKLKPLALILVAGAGAAVVAVAGPLQEGSPRSEHAAIAAKAEDAPDPRFTRKLADGTVVQVVAVSTYPSGPDTWWRPDGTPLKTAPCEPMAAAGEAAPVDSAERTNEGRREILLKVVDRPSDGEDLLMYLANSSTLGWRVERQGKVVPELKRLIQWFPEVPAVVPVRFRETRGPWKTLRKWGMQGTIAGQEGHTVIASDAIATRAGTAASITHDFSFEIPIRLIAVDQDGLSHPGILFGGGYARNFAQLSWEFAVPIENVEAFHFQTRPFEVATIPGVALHPRKPADSR